MTLEELLHQWLADESAPGVATLAALLPASKIVTGKWQTPPARGEGDAASADFPYASLGFEGDRLDWRTNCGGVRRTSVRIRVWSDVHATVAAIREALIGVFDDTGYSPVGAQREVRLSRLENAFAIEEEDGVWSLVFDFLAIHAAT
jgi:hypothetical protein